MEKDTTERQPEGAADGAGREDVSSRPSDAFVVRRERSRGSAERQSGMRRPEERGTGRLDRQLRRREQENEMKLRILWFAMGVLTVLLAVALLYEIGLGNGTKQTGAERMKESANRPAVVKELELRASA